MRYGKRLNVFFVLILAVCLIFGAAAPVYAGENDMLSEVRDLLNKYYVDPVSEDVIKAPTIKEMLARLGDKNTEYFTGEEFEKFMESLNMSFSGIGIELEMVTQGVKVLRVIDGYGAAKAGILTGDIIVEAQGYSFAGKTSDYCLTKLKGPAGTKVQVKVKRATQNLSFTIERMQIDLPLVESKLLENHIGYIAIYSFGEDTVEQFGKNAQSLIEKGADSWIIDLRNNGGGFTQAAFDLLGYFIGEKTAVIVRDRSSLGIAQRATKQNFTLEGPIIFLTNQYTASSSEIVCGAVRDYSKATILGRTTYGSGRVKALIPISNGDYLKLPIQRFFSPFNNPIDKVGISPHLDLTGFDELQTASLLLKGQNFDIVKSDVQDKTGYLQLSTGPYDFTLALSDLRKTENWKIGKKLLDSVYVSSTMMSGGKKGWERFPEEYLAERYKLYYPGYAEAGKLSAVPLNKQFTVTFTREMDWKSVTPESIELINTGNGERVKCTFVFSNGNSMRVNPQTLLKTNTTYWLVVHPNIKDAAGANNAGGVARVITVSE